MHWLLKAEPDSRIVKGKDVKYTIDDLEEEKIGTWDGVRNNEARKHLMNMKKGDTAFFYRSNCKEPGIVGTMTVVKEHYPDETAHDPSASTTVDPKLNNPKPAKPQTKQATKKETSKVVDKTNKEKQKEEEETSKPTKRRRTK